MNLNWRILSVALLPGVCVGLFFVGRAAFGAWFGKCGGGPECGGEVAFAAMLAAMFVALSAAGCGITAYLNRWSLTHLPAPTVLLAVAFSSVFLLLMFLTVPSWPFSGLGLLVTLALLCTLLSWVALGLAKRFMAPLS